MQSAMTRFSDAVYHMRDLSDLGMTQFSYRELKVLLLIDGTRSVAEVAGLLGTEPSSIVPAFARLIQLGLIQTEESIVSTDTAEVLYEDTAASPVEFTLARIPAAA